MSGIDDRIVSMQFDNKQFETNASATMSTLDKLKSSLNFDASTKGLNGLAEAGKAFTLDHIGTGVDAIVQKFSALSVVGITTLANISNKAVDAGLQLAKSLTISPIQGGFGEYETKLGSITTMLANTQKYGTKLPEVTASLDALNTYSDKTIYSFGDMTKNIGLFTNAGIRIGDATSMIKGFSNAAAASGTGAQQAAGAAYQLSQALSSGTVRLMDWRSLTNVGMGNKNMQDGIIQLAQAMGTFRGTGTNAAEAGKHFNDTLEKGWLSADVMSNYLKIMSGDMDEATMKSLHLSAAQIKTFKEQQVTAEDAATKVRTWTSLVGTLQEAVGSTWAQSAEIVIGNFDEATSLFTSISNKLGGVIGAIGDARNNMLQGWKDLGGRQDLLDIGSNIYQSIANIVKPITDAWKAIFPPDGGKGLKGFTGAIKTVTDVLVKVTAGLSNLTPIFKVLFGVFKIGLDIVKGVAKVFVDLLSVFGGVGIGGVTGLVGGFANLISKVIEFVNQGQYITKFFAGLTFGLNSVLIPLTVWAGRVADAFQQFFMTGDKDTLFSSLKKSFYVFYPLMLMFQAFMGNVSDGLGLAGAKATVLGNEVGGVFGKILVWVGAAIDKLQLFTRGLSDITSVLTRGDYTGSMATAFGLQEDSKFVDVLFRIRDGFLGIRDSVKSASDELTSFGSNGSSSVGTLTAASSTAKPVWEAIKATFEGLGKVFGWLGKQAKDFLGNITGQDVVALASGGFIAAMIIELHKLLKLFEDIKPELKTWKTLFSEVFSSVKNTLKSMQQELKAKAIEEIALAVGILSASIIALSMIPADKLKTGTEGLLYAVTGIVAIMAALQFSTKGGGSEKQILATATALVLIANAMLVMSAAVAIMGNMDLATLATGIGAITAIMAVFMGFAVGIGQLGAGGKQILATATAVLIMANALLLMAGVIAIFAAFDVKTMAEGLGYIAAILAVFLAFSVALTDGTGGLGAAVMLAAAASMVVMAAGLLLMASAIKKFSDFTAGSFFEGLGYIAAALVVLAGAAILFEGSIPGALGMIAIAVALGFLATAIQLFSAFDAGTFFEGLGYIAAAIVVIGVASAVAALPIAALGVAVLALGLGLLAAGVGMGLFATGFATLAAVGAAGSVALTAAFAAIIGVIPALAEQVGKGIIAIAGVIAESGPVIIATMVTLIGSLLTAIATLAPQLIDTAVILLLGFLKAVEIVAPQYIQTGTTLILALLNAIVLLVPAFVTAGMKIITGVLRGIGDNIQDVIAAGTDLVTKFIKGIGDSALDIIDAAAETLLTFLNGLATAIRTYTPQLQDAGWNILTAIIDGVTGGVAKIGGKLWDAAKNIGSKLLNGVKDFLGIHSPSKEFTKVGEYSATGLIDGLANMGAAVYKAAAGTGEQAMNGLTDSLSNPNKLLTNDVNLTPVIKPVLDLTSVQADAKKLNGMIQDQTSISVSMADMTAQSIAASQRKNQQETVGAETTPAASTSLTFIQNNTSPKEISPADTYRNTKNQISQAKEALTV